MRILVLGNLYPPHFLGGYEILCAQVVQGLRARGHEIVVLTSDHGCAPHRAEEDGIRVHRVLRLHQAFDRPARASARQRWLTGRFNAARTREILARESPDRVFVWSQLRLTLGPARAAERSGVPVGYTLNDYHLRGYQPRAFGKRPGRLLHAIADRTVFRTVTLRGLRMAHVTCISRTLKEELMRAGLPLGHAEVHHQGIPVERFPAKEDPGCVHRPLRVLYAGQLHDYKGVHVLVEALRRLQSAGRLPGGWVASLAGTGPAAYVERLQRLGEGMPGLRFLGRVPHEAMPALYRDHDVLVFPSLWKEPFGLTHLEAMASGSVVVSTPEGGPGEFLEDGRTALLFSAGDDHALAGALERLAEEPGLARELARNGREVVLRDFSLSRYVDEMEDFILRAPLARAVAAPAPAPPPLLETHPVRP